MLYFDHTYTPDKNHKFLKRLEKAGFRLDPREVEHPGRAFCRFIMLESPRPGKRCYLEFVNVKSKNKGSQRSRSGLSFGYTKNLAGFYKKLRRQGKLEASYEHKNYEWKKDSRSVLPGWNFLIFKGSPMPGIFPWITEYEVTPKRKVLKPRTHPNGVRTFEGFELEINAKGKKFLKTLLGKEIKTLTTLPCGTKLYIRFGKRNQIRSVVLRAASLPRLVKRFNVDEEIEFHGQKAVKVNNPMGRWNVVIY